MRGPLICIRIEANGSATYLNKVAAPDQSSRRSFRLLRFPVGQYSRRRRLPSGSRMVLQTRGPLICIRIEANGSATYLNKVVAPDETQAIISDTPFPSPAIFSPSALTKRIRVAIKCGGRLSVSGSEANGSATYLNKVIAPDKAAADRFGRSVSQSGNILAVGAHYADPDGMKCWGRLYVQDRGQWLCYLLKQGCRSR